MPNAILGVSGSVAAYRAADLARELMRQGFTVRVCLTRGAAKFVAPALFEALTGQPCLVDAFEEPERGKMAHIDWARWADVMVVAPATGNVLCKLSQGVADDMLTTLALAYSGPWVLAPAMNPAMYASEPVREAVQTLRARAAAFVEPEEGEVACGDHGQGKFASIESIVAAVLSVARRSKLLAGRRVLITSGPTEEPIDIARMLTNRSSGKMGAALARAALLMGAEVTVVAGPQSAALPIEAEVIRVRTAQEMLGAAGPFATAADWIIGAAAVADYRPAEPMAGKLRRSEAELNLRLVPNPDIIAELAKLSKPGAHAVGFAAEPDASIEVAREKLSRKGLFAIAHNDVSQQGQGFGASNNALTLIRATGEPQFSGVQSKLGCAIWLFEKLLQQV